MKQKIKLLLRNIFLIALCVVYLTAGFLNLSFVKSNTEYLIDSILVIMLNTVICIRYKKKLIKLPYQRFLLEMMPSFWANSKNQKYHHEYLELMERSYFHELFFGYYSDGFNISYKPLIFTNLASLVVYIIKNRTFEVSFLVCLGSVLSLALSILTWVQLQEVGKHVEKIARISLENGDK